MVLVCTHGTRDACCAVRGRPIVAALARALPDEVWECTHLGGHRFAGTLLSLPDGTCLGRLDPDTAVGAVLAHREGRVDGRYLRGQTRWIRRGPGRARAVLTAHGPASVDDLVPGRRRRPTATTPASRCSAAGRCPSRVVVDVVAEALPDAPLSCGDKPKAHTAYRATVRP